MALRVCIVGALLAGPTVVAFFSGGYFDRGRLWAGIVAWALVALGAVALPRPFPRGRAGWLALGGLAALTAWTGASIAWAPDRSLAVDDSQRLLLYLGFTTVAIAALRPHWAARALEPALALGTLVVVGEGLSERVVPGLVTLERSLEATGRLEQPLTYWNAMGLLGALGFVLCARLVGDHSRPAWLRATAAAGAMPLAVGEYLSFSRGGLLALAAGLLALVILAPTRPQLRALVLLVVVAVNPVLASDRLDGVRALSGPMGTREEEGLAMLGILALSMAVAAAVTAWMARRERVGRMRTARLPFARHAGVLVAVGLAMLTAGLFVLASVEQDRQVVSNPTRGATAARLGSVESNRQDFWKVAFKAFEREPVRGLGSGGFAAEWQRERTIRYFTRDAHSLYVETPAELGLVGALFLLALAAGLLVCVLRAHRRHPTLSSGWIAALTVFCVHAGLDWDWEFPAVSLVALLLAAAIVAWGELPDRGAVAQARRPGRDAADDRLEAPVA